MRLREYMRVLGMLDAAYWGSWFTTHIIILWVSGALCAFIGQCAPSLLNRLYIRVITVLTKGNVLWHDGIFIH